MWIQVNYLRFQILGKLINKTKVDYCKYVFITFWSAYQPQK